MSSSIVGQQPTQVVLAAFSGGSNNAPRRTTRQLQAQSYLRAFICSVLAMDGVHLFLFLSPPPTRELLARHLQDHPRVHLLSLEGDAARLQHGRYLAYLELLRRLGTNVSKVVLSDASDVVFQGSPFSLIERGLYTAEESRAYTLGTHRPNAFWVRELYGALQLAAVGAMPVLCSGVTMGTGTAVLRYLEMMAEESALRLRPERLTELRQAHGRDLCRGFDQGMHNVLVRTRLRDVTTVLPANGPVFHGNARRCAVDVAMNGSRLSEALGARSMPLVAHQYGRVRGACQRRVRLSLTCRDGNPQAQPPHCGLCSRLWPQWLGDAANSWRSIV